MGLLSAFRLVRERLSNRLTDFDTAGPPEDEDVGPHGALPVDKSWKDGVWSGAVHRAAHPGRVGGPIVPQAVVVHTTDMLPRTWNALISSWERSRGSGAAAHFLIGRTPEEGVVQMVPISRNGNHAGGAVKNGRPLYGQWRTPEGRFIHPNRVSVGIELHAAGKLRWSKTHAEYLSWPERKVTAVFGPEDIVTDELGRPWHAVTQYQLDTLGALLHDLRPMLAPSTIVPVPSGAFIKDRGHWDNTFGVAMHDTLVGHVSLDPLNKTDPGPQVMRFLDEVGEKENYR